MIRALLVIASSLLFVKLQPIFQSKRTSMEELNIYLPFIFSEEIDPRKTYTVGDQVVSEHIFAYHYSASLSKAKLSLISDVEVDEKFNKISFRLRKEVKDFNGQKLNLSDICRAIKMSLSGTQHTNYSSLFKSINCEENQIEVEMTTIPVNIEYWLRSTDFAIYKPENLPIKPNSLFGTTGPYSIASFNSRKVSLKRNSYFPKELTSNDIEDVSLISYSQNDIEETLRGSSQNDIWYLYGYSIDQNILDQFKEKKYKVQIFPNEWLVYLGFQENLNLDERRFISSKIDKIRKEIEDNIVQGQLAYSMIPADRAFGLSRFEYEQIKEEGNLNSIRPKIKLATLDEWASMPLFKFILKKLDEEIDVDLVLFPRNELKKVFSKDEADFYLAPMGISLADPLGNYSFLHSNSLLFQKPENLDMITKLYVEKSFEKFDEEVKKIEVELLKNRIILPIGHFPGLVFESPLLIRDEVKSWDWGIQAWTYKVF